VSRPSTSTCDGGQDLPRAPVTGADPSSIGDSRSRPWIRRPRVLVLLLLVVFGALAAVAYWRWDEYRARFAWEDAEQALGRRDLAAAASHFDRYITLRSSDPAGWFQAARTARRRGQFPDAKRYLAECEQRGGNADAIHLERDLMLVQQGVIGEADVRLRATVGPDHPDAALVLEALARGYSLAERWADARQACELWRSIEPDAPLAWLWGGWVCERMVQVEQAGEFYQRALELAPDDRDVRVAFARLQLRQRNPFAAAPHYEWVLARDADDAEASLGLAQCRIESGRAADAVPLIEHALSRDPTSSLAMALQGRAAMDRGDAAAAERWLRQAVESDPGDAEALHVLILALRAQRKDDEAAQLARRLDDLQRDLRRLTDLMRMIGPQLADAGPCCEAGVIALRVGRTRQGLNLLEDALRRKGDHRPVHAALADYYRKSGRLDLAEVHQSLADKP